MAKAATGPPTGDRDYSIAALDRALDVLAALMQGGSGPLKTIAQQAGCNQATTLRILHTLQNRGMVQQESARGPWRLGVACLAVGRAASLQSTMELAAQPLMADLAKATHEGVYLSVRDGQEAETIAVSPGERQVRLYAKTGDRALLYSGPGRLLLAYAPAAIQHAVLTGKLVRAGPASPVSPLLIAGNLSRLPHRGWLITVDEIEDQAVTVSVPVRDTGGSVLAVLSIMSPRLRLSPGQARSLLPNLLEAAGRLTSAIGLQL